MADQTWLDGVSVTPAHDGTTETRLDSVSVAPVHTGTEETRLDSLSVFVVHSSPTRLYGARLATLHDAPAEDAALKGARLAVLHNAPPADAALLGVRLAVLHTGPKLATGSGVQGVFPSERLLQGVAVNSRNRFRKN